MQKRVLNEISKINKRSAHITERHSSSMQINAFGKNLIDFCSTDFFGLTSEPGIKKLYINSVEQFGIGADSGRFTSGYTKYHQSFEERFARHLGCEASILFTSRNQATLSLFTAIARDGDLVISNESPITPIGDVSRLLKSDYKKSNFRELDKLKEDLSKLKIGSKAIFFVEAISPITGRAAPLKEISELCVEFDAALIVDESFSLGIYGPSGCGMSYGLKPFAIIGGFGAAFIGQGGYIAGSHSLCALIQSRSRALSNEAPPPVASIMLFDSVLEMLISLEAKRKELSVKSASLKMLPVTSTLSLADHTDSPIVSFAFRIESNADEFQSYLLKKGIYSENVPRGTFSLSENFVRAFVTTKHSQLEIDLLKKAVLDWVN